MYRCVTETVEGFVQQVAVNLLPHGYRFYITGQIPEHKDPEAVDAKLIERYALDLSKWARARKRKQGQASVQYLRHGRFFVLIATAGQHDFFTQETRFRDVRRVPLQCFGYSIGAYQRAGGSWHPSVRIAPRVFKDLKEEFAAATLRRTAREFGGRIGSLPFAPFAPVRSQCFTLLRLVNRRRKRAGLPLVRADCVRRRRKPVVVFRREPNTPP